MWCDARVLVLAALSLLAEPSLASKKHNITIGYLPCVTGAHRDRQGLTISGAISIALEELNNSTDILPDVELMLEWHDTKCENLRATRLLTDMICSGVVAFFGPEGTCRTEATITQSRNLPMMSYKCADQITGLPNFVNMEPRAQATKPLISLLLYYRWNKFSIIYEESWKSMALMLANNARRYNMTVNDQQPIDDGFKCCMEMLPCCVPNFWHWVIRNTREKTRIYVFLGSHSTLIDMMTAMQSQSLFSKGEYMVIFVDMLAYSPNEALKYLIKPEDQVRNQQCPDSTEFRKLAQSLLVVTTSEPAQSYDTFKDQVRLYNTLNPFVFPNLFGSKFPKYVSIYAAYLYDSVKLYAKSLDEIIKEEALKEELTYAKLISIATNGSRIVAKMISSSPYKSISGMSIRLNERADSEGNFSVLAYKPTRYLDVSAEFNCNYSMIPVGHFLQSNKELPDYKLNPRLPIDWADNVKP